MFTKIASFGVILATAILLAGPGLGDDRTIYIRNDPGGDVGLYQVKVAVAKDLKLNVVIDGICASACTLLIGLPKAQVCATERARLHFHRARLARPVNNGRALVRMANAEIFNTYPAGIRDWIVNRGGLTDRILKMQPDEVAKFLPRCGAAPTLS